MDLVHVPGNTCYQELSLCTVVKDLILRLRPPVSRLSADDCRDLANSSLWDVDLDWSEQAPALRYMAVHNPHLFTFEYARDSITQLRVVEKQVTTIGEELHLFSNLEELTLTGNFIGKVSTAQLPLNLKVLELCYNTLTEMPSGEDSMFPQLKHLGLAFNHLSCFNLTPSNWCALLSLDLSRNYLSDLPGTVTALRPLSSLRSLMLNGNPITLVQCYKKYIIDCLRQLICLDGCDVTQSMREEASGAFEMCSNNPELVTICEFKIAVSEILNLPSLQTEDNEQEDKAVRFLLSINYDFLKSGEYILLSELSNCMKEILVHTSFHNSSNEAKVFFEPVIYKVDASICSKMIHKCRVPNLGSLVALLADGIRISVHVSKVVYEKVDHVEEECPVARKLFNGNKSGRASAQSGASSTTKKPVTPVGNPKSKGKTILDQPALPSDGWKIVQVNNFHLGSEKFDVSALLEDKSAISVTATLRICDDDRIRMAQLICSSDAEGPTNSVTTSDITLCIQLFIEQI